MRSWRAAAVAASTLGLIALGTTGCGGDDTPQTANAVPTITVTTTAPPTITATTPPAPVPTPEETEGPHGPELPPEPVGEQRTLFDVVTITQPDEWKAGSGDADSQKFTDTSDCIGADACPKITFLLLSKGTNKVNYMPDPIGVWVKQEIDGKGECRDNVSDLGPITADGVVFKGYKLSCQGVDDFAWYAPAKKLFVMGGDGGGYVFPLETTQQVLASATWN